MSALDDLIHEWSRAIEDSALGDNTRLCALMGEQTEPWGYEESLRGFLQQAVSALLAGEASDSNRDLPSELATEMQRERYLALVEHVGHDAALSDAMKW